MTPPAPPEGGAREVAAGGAAAFDGVALGGPSVGTASGVAGGVTMAGPSVGEAIGAAGGPSGEAGGPSVGASVGAASGVAGGVVGGPADGRPVGHIHNLRRKRQQRICAPISYLGSKAKRRVWLIVGPVRDPDVIDPSRFSFSAHVVAKPSLSGREVFARAVVKLLYRKRLTSRAAAHASLHLLQSKSKLHDDDGDEEPSWAELPASRLTSLECERVLRRAKTITDKSHHSVERGDVTIAWVGDAHTHPWVKYDQHLRDRRVSNHVAVVIREAAAFAALTLEEQAAVIAAAPSAAALLKVRKALELVEAGEEESGGSKKKRARRRSGAFGKSMAKMLPNARKVRAVIKAAVDNPDGTPHSLLTLEPDGAVRVWRYVLGSASAGTRWYVSGDGTRKRLAAPYHRRRQRDPNAKPMTTAEADADLVSSFHIAKSTFLEDADETETEDSEEEEDEAAGRVGPGESAGGTGREVVVAIEFDPVGSLQRALSEGCVPATEAEIQAAPVAVTLAGDGGPVRRSALTVFTLTVSSTLLRSGRTPLIPVLFLLSGEHAIHSAVGERLQELLRTTLHETFTVPVKATSSTSTTSAPLRCTAPLSLPFFLRVCGDFALLAHVLTLTGCGDVSRCPYWWPCLPASYLSGSLLERGSGAGRDAAFLSSHWELVVWGLARWCSLGSGHGQWRGSDGRVLWACDGCGTDMEALSTSTTIMACEDRTCNRFEDPQAPLLPRVAYTPLSNFFKRLRRRLGGSRGYPLLGDIPFVLQAPVLHCTGKISKGLMFFLLALMGEPMETKAKRAIYKLMGRGNLGGLYLREFGRLGALIVAVPGVLGKDVNVDHGAVVMLQLSQLLTASWRRAISTKPVAERESAASTLQLAAALLAPIYSALKPLDPVTKKAGVWNLYLHTAMAHVRGTIGEAVPTLNFICDDNIEGTIAELNRFFNRRANNVSRGESIINKEALSPTQFKKPKGRDAADQMLFTQEVVLCPCVSKVGPTAIDDFKAVVRYACRDPSLTVTADPPAMADPSVAANASVTCDIADTTAHTSAEAPASHAASAAAAAAATEESAMEALVGLVPLVFTLGSKADGVRRNSTPQFEPSMELRLQDKLEQVQRRMSVCLCGALTGGRASKVGMKAMDICRGPGDGDGGVAGVPRGQWEGDGDDAEVRVAAGVDAHMKVAAEAEAGTVTLEDARGYMAFEGGAEYEAADGRDATVAADGKPVDAPAEGPRSYTLERDDLNGEDSDTDADSDADDVDDALPIFQPVDQAKGNGEFLLQAAAEDDGVSPFLPSVDVVDAVLSTARYAPSSRRAALVRSRVEEDLVLVQLLIARLQTTEFVDWVRRDGVLVWDVERAAQSLRHALIRALVKLTGGGGGTTA